MKKAKKILVLLLVLAFAISSLAACTKKESDNKESQTQGDNKTPEDNNDNNQEGDTEGEELASFGKERAFYLAGLVKRIC